MTNKPIYIKIYDKLKSAIKGGTLPAGKFSSHRAGIGNFIPGQPHYYPQGCKTAF